MALKFRDSPGGGGGGEGEGRGREKKGEGEKKEQEQGDTWCLVSIQWIGGINCLQLRAALKNRGERERKAFKDRTDTKNLDRRSDYYVEARGEGGWLRPVGNSSLHNKTGKNRPEIDN